MKKHTLREVAKLLSGLALGDFLAQWWVIAQGLLPVTFFGLTWTKDLIVPGMMLDGAIFLLLVHYGWNIGKIPVLRERFYLKTAGTIFAVVAFLHLIRIFSANVDLVLIGWVVPVWLSWIGLAIAGYLSYMSFRLVNRTAP